MYMLLSALSAIFLISNSCANSTHADSGSLLVLAQSNQCVRNQTVNVSRADAERYLSAMSQGHSGADILSQAGLQFDTLTESHLPDSQSYSPSDPDIETEGHLLDSQSYFSSDPGIEMETQLQAYNDDFVREFLYDVRRGVAQKLVCECYWVGGKCYCNCVKSN